MVLNWVVWFRRLVGIVGYSLALVILLVTSNIVLSFMIALGCSILFWVSTLFQSGPGILESDSLVDKVKKRLGVEHVYIKIRKKSTKKVAFGGFAIPLIPFFVSIGYNDSIDKTEAMIHELVHAHYFIYGYQTAVMYVMLMAVLIGQYIGSLLSLGIVFLIGVGFMLFQEYLAFTYTYRVAAEFGYKVRKWSWKVLTKYIIYYGVWFLFIGSAVYIGNMGAGLFTLFYLLVVGFLVQKGFYYFGLWFNKRWPADEKQ